MLIITTTVDFVRNPKQLYVWWVEESTINAGGEGRYLQNYFNVTQFVRRSSDIFSPYLNFPILLHLIGYVYKLL